MKVRAPFPWFGGKSRAADLVRSRFGDVTNYVEPFFGSGAVLLLRPQPFIGTETVNDKDGLIANFWRATQAEPEAVARWADCPVNENDLHARHSWLVREALPVLAPRLEGDPDYYDPKIAGWWAWGLSCWIGSGFCSGNGPWQSIETEDGHRQLVHLGNAGRGVNRQLVHLGSAGQGVNRQLAGLLEWFERLADRLKSVRVCCGDWTRVMGPTPMFPVSRSSSARTAVFLDPPYADTAGRDKNLYRVDDLSVAHAVRGWAIDHGDDPRYRIALCGYDGEHSMPDSWTCIEGKSTTGHGYGGQSKNGYANKERERIWFSPHCLKTEDVGLFSGAAS